MLKTNNAFACSAANWLIVASLTRTAGDCMLLAISSNIGRSFLLPVSIIRTGVDIVNVVANASAQKTHPVARQQYEGAEEPI